MGLEFFPIMPRKELSEERIQYLKNDYSRGFIRFCGFRAEQVEWGRFESSLIIEEHHRQQDGFIHAGVMAAMADHTAGYSAFTTVDKEFQILTIEFKINFLKPAYGTALSCRAHLIREGRRIIVSESEVFDLRNGNSMLVAKAMVTMMAVHRESLSANSSS